MPIRCVAVGCSNNNKHNPDIHFHRFPIDPKLRKTWILKLRRDKWKPTTCSYVCSKHFTSECYILGDHLKTQLGFKTKPKLVEGSIPTIFSFSKPIRERPLPAKLRRKEIVRELLNSSNKENENEISLAKVLTNNDNLKNYSNQSNDSEDCDNCSIPVRSELTPRTNPSKFCQVNITKSSKVKRCQAGPKMKTVGTQTDEVRISNVPTETETDCASDCDYTDAGDLTSDDESDQLDSSFTMSESCDESDCDDDFQDTNPPSKTVESAWQENKYIVFESCLLELFKNCEVCHSSIHATIHIKGTCIFVTSVCVNDHVTHWQSQPTIGQRPVGNLLQAAGILYSGCNPSESLRIFNSVGISSISLRTYHRLQTCFLFPTVEKVWESKQADLFATLKHKSLCVGGDGRADSPGFCAKYGSYTFLEMNVNKVLHIELVQSNEVNGSTYMEKEGLHRGLNFIHNQDLHIGTLITDRHVQIKSYMKKQHPSTLHLFDVWHVSKGIKKKITTASKKSDCEILAKWVKGICNHLYWTAATSDGNREIVLEKWQSILNHVANIHKGHGKNFPKCAHGKIAPRKWIKKHSKPYNLLSSIICSKTLLSDLPKLSPHNQTSSVEAVHSLMTHFARKSTHYSHEGMKARMFLTALHYNENSERAQAKTISGDDRWFVAYPKAKKGEAVARPIKEASTYGYVKELLDALFRYYPTFNQDDRHDVNKPSPLSAAYHCNKAEVIKAHKSRFNKQM